MDRSRSKRNYYYDHQDYEGEPPVSVGRTKPRYNNNNNNHHYPPGNSYRHHHRGSNHNGGMNNPNNSNRDRSGLNNNPKDPSLMVTTTYRILCHDMKAGGVIGKSGSIIKSIRQHTGAWINVHELMPGDEERIIEISDTRRRDPEGRMPSFSPAQEALFLIHDRILESDGGAGFGGYADDEEDYGGGSGGFRGGGNRVATRMVVSRMHVGCLLGKGGKIIEQMRMETKTQIRILPRDHSLPRCVSMSEEIVQLGHCEDYGSLKMILLDCGHFALIYWVDVVLVLLGHFEDYGSLTMLLVLVNDLSIDYLRLLTCTFWNYGSRAMLMITGDINNVKNAVANISSRLRESQHRDRSHFHGRLQSPDRFFPDDDYIPHMNNTGRRSSIDGPRYSGSNYRSNNYASRSSGYSNEAGGAPMPEFAQPYYGEDIVFRILCPIDKVDRVVGESEGIVELLQNEIGVDIKVADPVAGSDEQVIIISSEEGPDDELFPAQEALLHIQTRIVDLASDKDNIITTRLLVPASEIGCLEGRDGSLSEMRRLTGANINILPREEVPVYGNDELVQIVGEIKSARDALVEVTSRLRSHLYREFFQKETTPSSNSAQGPIGSFMGAEVASPINTTSAQEGQSGISDPPAATYQNLQTVASTQPSKEAGGSGNETIKQSENERREDVPSTINRISVPLVTRSTLEVVIPEHAVPKLIAKSKHKLTVFSELSGATVTLVEDRLDATQKMIQISGTPEQSEKAQSLLQGFLLSTQEDEP
ncbi:hypothetical protein EZV62_024470 [Acer yangbiense]|uniref:K Homology domain-containing protein n=1 Tax=Acer yangbiense TaxID=1000413 RepID=A0A5C7GVR7_9ROSI|nr:hypothetical protein EZV62_024470 [Acer yangbiense]